MGYSATAAAFDTLKKLDKFCAESTGLNTSWKVADTEFFYEIDTNAEEDGAIRGEVFRIMDHGLCEKVGTFFISKDGKTVSFPAVPSLVWA